MWNIGSGKVGGFIWQKKRMLDVCCLLEVRVDCGR